MESFPPKITPMKAVPGDLPVSGEWTFEVKWDGMRLIGSIDGGLVLRSGNQIDATARFPELAPLVDVFGGKPAVVDGEVVAVDDDGRPSFAALQRRMHLTNAYEIGQRLADTPVAYQIFDLLHFDGHDLTGLPIEDRRQILHAVVEPGVAWRTTTVHDDGGALLDVVRQQNLEGIIAKRAGSTYRSGSRSPAWRKIKVRHQQEFVVAGWSPGAGARSRRIGALLIGYYDGGALRCAGRVGSGFSGAELDRLHDRLADLERDSDPFDPPVPVSDAKGVRFVEPNMVVEVAFAEWSSEGRLRHPVYLGERFDVDPATVTNQP